MDYKKLTEEYKEEAFKLVEKLVSFPSVLDEYKENADAPFGKANKEVLNWFLNHALEDGFTVKNVDNYAGHIEFGSGDEILGILAHLDVVPVTKEEWISDPFTLSFREDKMFGRGSLDDKGPLAASYIALKALKNAGFKPNKKIRLIVGCDEESGSRCLERYLQKETKPTLGFSPDANFPLIYGEKAMLSYDILSKKGDNVITYFNCGIRYNMVPSVASARLNVNLEKEFYEYLKENKREGEYKDGLYTIYGLGAHAAFPTQGINAAFYLFDFIHQYTDSKVASFIDKYLSFDTEGKKMGYDCFDPDMLDLTSNLAIVRIDENSIQIGVNCRVPLDSYLKVIEDKINAASEEFGYEAKVLSTSKRHYVDPNSTLVKTLMHAYQEGSGDYKNGPITIGGGTYAREIGNAVAFGPVFVGREDVCHISNEYMFVDDFVKAIAIYMQAIAELCK